MKNNKSVKILWNFPLMFSNFAWQMAVLLVDHSLQGKQRTALPTLSCCTSYSSLASLVHPLITNGLWGSAVRLTFQTWIFLIIHLTSIYLAWVAYSYEAIIKVSFSLFNPLLTSHLSSISFLKIFVKIHCPSPKLFPVRICLVACCTSGALLICFWNLIEDRLSSSFHL